MSYSNAWQKTTYIEPQPNNMVEGTARTELTARQPSPDVQQSPSAADWLPVHETDVTLGVDGMPIYADDLSPSGRIENQSASPMLGSPGAVVPDVGQYYGAFTQYSAAQRGIDQGYPEQYARGIKGDVHRDEAWRTSTEDQGPATSQGLPSIEAMRRGFNSFDQNNSHRRSPLEMHTYDNRRILTPQRVHYATRLFPNAATVPQDQAPVVPDHGASKGGGSILDAFRRLTAPPQVAGQRRVPPATSDVAASHSGGMAYGAPLVTDPQSYSDTGMMWVIA